VLKVNHISLRYNNVDVVKNVFFEINAGERLVIVGASGCGKTTLLKSIAGFHPIFKGNILFKNQHIIDPSQQLVPGHERIKLVNQDFNLDDFHTVEENIRLRLLQFDMDYQNQRTNELLKITELEKFKKYQARNLSGGQKQRLTIARALADEPELLLLDEPFNQLDYHLKQKIETYILDYLEKYNISAILVSHNGEEAMRWANRIAFMKKGKIMRIDSPNNFYNNPSNKNEAGFFGTINTVRLNGAEISFRPHQFSKKITKKHTQKLNITFFSKINKGWYFDFQFKVGKKSINLYSRKNISHLNGIWVSPIDFKS